MAIGIYINKYKKGFSLAEVLLTLAIVGVVAALTVPSLMVDSQTAQLRAVWKKAFSVINQASLEVIDDNGGNIFGLISNDTQARDLFKSVISTTKVCDAGQAYGNCWSVIDSLKQKNGAPVDNTWYNAPSFVSADGMYFNFVNWISDCSKSLAGDSNVCGEIIVDINGPKPPNQISFDVYYINVFSQGIKPAGTTKVNDCPAETFGSACSAKYLFE